MNRSHRSRNSRPSLFHFGFSLFAIFGALSASTDSSAWGGDTVTIRKLDDRLRVELSGSLFTEYVFKGHAKPILYPIIGPHGIGMTRNYPMREDVKGEAHDHPHHESLWFSHGDVNGVSFWHLGEKGGKIIHDKILKIEDGSARGMITTKNKWVAPGGKVLCTDTRAIAFRAEPGVKMVDYEITIHASEEDVTFGDTKEGTMGIRTHPSLRLANDPRHGVLKVTGKAINSEGHKDGELWGKRARWVDYWGVIDGKTVGIAIFDHPKNPRHPTWWHARQYGLIAANAFGVHDFEKKPKGTGDMVIPAGKSVTFGYRFVFHEGDAEQARIAERYKKFAATERLVP